MAIKNNVADDMAPVGHSVWPRRAPHLVHLALPSGPVWTPWGTPSGPPFGPRQAPRLAPRWAPRRVQKK
jgi:hypothetical protein